MTLSPPAALPVPPSAQAAPTPAGAPVRVAASAGKRAGAYLIDFAIVAVVALLIWLTTGSLVLGAVAVVELWMIGWLWEGHAGATPGNLVCGIRTVRRGTVVSVGAGRLFLRSLLMGLSHVVPVLLPVGLAASGALDGVAGAGVIDIRRAKDATPADLARTSLEMRTTTAAPAASTVAIAPKDALITQAPTSAASEPTVAVPEQPPASVPAGPGTIPAFELSDGTVIRATGIGFIGRAPRAPEAITDAILIRVPDGARSLSRTHAQFGVEDGELWAQDLGSANGASVRHLGGSVTTMTPHRPYMLVPGDVLLLGDDAALTVRRLLDRSAGAAAPRRATPTPTPTPTEAVPPEIVTRLEQASPPVVSTPPAPVTPPPAAPYVAPAPEAAAPVEPVAPEPPTQFVALQFQDGTTVPIRGTGYIGRAPRLPEDERADAALVAVPDGDRSVSRTHGRFGIVSGQTWFEDLGSGNGSALRTGDGRSGPMTPHQRFTLVPGMVLQLGDCVIRVISA